MNKIAKEVLPSNILIDYLWAVLKLNDPKVWDSAKYGGMIPITPNAQEPEFDEYDGPHIVYSYAEQASTQEGILEGSMGLVIHDQNLRRMNQTVNTVRAAFDGDDEAAGRVNHFSSRYMTKGGKESPFLGIRFTNTRVGMVGEVDPEKLEGGRGSVLALIEYSCVMESGVNLTLTNDLMLSD